MRLALLLVVLGVSLCFASPSPMLTNPSACMLGWQLSDNNCPEGSNFGTSDVFSIAVTDAGGQSLGEDVYLAELRLIIAHSWVSDLNISLVAPSGKRIDLSSDNGGAGQHYGDPGAADCSRYTTFAYEACTSIQTAAAPFAGRYLPEEDFSILHDGTDPNGIWRLEICDDIPEDVGTLEYVALIFEPLSCLSAKNVRVLSQDSTAVVLTWEGANDCSQTWIEYGPPGFVPGTDSLPGTGTLVPQACSPMLLTGMLPNTQYEVYVRTFCSVSGRFSANSCALRVETGCAPGGITNREDFNTQDDCIPGCATPCPLTGTWYNEVGDDLDWTVGRGATPTFETGPSGDAEGSGKYLFLETSFQACSVNKNAFLRSACMIYTGSSSDDCDFSFEYHLYGSQIGFLSLQLSMDGGNSWSEIWRVAGNQGDSWKKAYVDLPGMAAETLFQMRFVGGGAKGPKGDMALDNLVFYQAREAENTYVYYRDGDGDGYGLTASWIKSCSATPPLGYAVFSGDCRDDDPRIHPGLAEIPCDGLDNNCNGMADDYLLPPLVVVGDTICAGERPVLCVIGEPERFVFWYATAEGDDLVGIGNCFSPVLPENIGSSPVVYRFYAVESDFICTSSVRSVAEVLVYPKPALSLAALPEICAGEELRLESVALRDTHTTGGVLRFHSSLPATEANVLAGTSLLPSADTLIYAQVTNPFGCSATLPVPVRVNPLPEVRIFPQDNFDLCLNSEAVLRAVGASGTAPYAFRWNVGGTADTLLVEAGSTSGVVEQYVVSLTDASGCRAFDTVRVNPIARISAFSRNIRAVSACGASDGEIALLPLDGLPPFRYAWDDGRGRRGDTSGIEGAFVLGQLEQGNYRFTISDNSEQACVFVTPAMLVGGPGAVLAEPVITPLGCYDSGDGSICIPVLSGNASFHWNTGAEEACISNLAAGTYSVTVVAGACTTIFSDLQVAAPEPIRINWELTEPDCADATNGTIQAKVGGGTSGYRYAWRSGQRTPSIGNLGSGKYVLSVRDAKGCEATDSVLLRAPDVLQIQVDSIRPVSCSVAADGWIRAGVTGGTPPYIYRWDNGQNTALAAGLSPGSYQLTVTDANHCIAIAAFTLEAPLPLELELTALHPPVCPGDDSGSLAVRLSGGSGGYRYRWSTGDTLATISGLSPGSYTLTVSDGIFCEVLVRSFVLNAPSGITLDADLNLPTCVGSRDGGIHLGVSSGQAPFEISWANGASGNTLRDLPVGEYPVHIRDGRGCELDTSFWLTAPQVFDPEFTTFDPTCSGSADGLIQARLPGNLAVPVQFSWSTGSEGGLLTGLPAGAYQLRLSDNRGCSFTSDTLRLNDPLPVGIEVLHHSGTTCPGEASGSVEVLAFGGKAPYTYRWLPGLWDVPALDGLGAGSYQVQVRDSQGCPADTTLAITALSTMLVDIDYDLNERCIDNTTNRLRAAISGGVPQYRYEWSDGSTTPTLENVPLGDYALTVTDEAGCSASSNVVKIKAAYNPLRLERAEILPVTCFGAADGKFVAQVSGGSANYRFHFSNNQVITTAETEIILDNLLPGRTYAVTITDMETGCAVTSARLPLQSTAPLQIYAPQASDAFCAGTAGGRIAVTVVGGTPAYTYSWYDQSGQQVGTEKILNGIPSGTYSLWVRDANQCVDSLTGIVINNRFPEIRVPDSLITLSPVSCKGGKDGAIHVAHLGGSPPITYTWGDGYRGTTRTGLAAGQYSITLTDSKNCQLELSDLVLSEPDSALGLDIFSGDIFCYGDNAGYLTFFPKGGTAPYHLETGGQVIAYPYQMNHLTAGSYPVVLRDANSCEIVALARVEEAAPLRIQFDLYPDPVAGGSIVAQVTGGQPDYRYLWNTGDTTSRVTELDQGVYSLTVTDAYGCEASQQVLFVDNTELAQNKVGYRIFPNPASDLLYIESIGFAEANQTIALYNPWGMRVKAWDQPLLPRGMATLAVADLPRGLYWLCILKPNGNLVFRYPLLLQ